MGARFGACRTVRRPASGSGYTCTRGVAQGEIVINPVYPRIRDKVFASADEAIQDVRDGASVMLGGFVTAGHPATLIYALKRSGMKNLTTIGNNIGIGDVVDELCENRQIGKAIVSFAIRATGSKQSRFEEQYRRGEVELELVPQGTLAERIRAGGAGIGGFYVKTGVGTPLAEGKETRVIDGETYVLERPLRADFAFLKAKVADRAGNLVYQGASRNFNVPMATAAQVVIAEVEEIVEVGSIPPEAVVTPGIFVDRIVRSEHRLVRWYG